jgi:hypothetical protein
MPSDKQKAKPEKPRKRPWQTPTVKTGSLFEANSLACAKMPSHQMCRQVGIRQS